MRQLKIILCLLAFSISTSLYAKEAETVGWQDLTKKMEFDDPFKKLSSDQTYYLSIYARVQEMQKSIPDRVSEAMLREAEEAELFLRDEGVDIEYLLLKRAEIQELRRKQANAVVPELHELLVRIPGYALPLEMSGQQVMEFLLVPWVGACIHTPPPPPNQIVYVEIEKGFISKELFEPIWVTGEMFVKASTKHLFLVDGSDDINVGYRLRADNVLPYN